MGYVLILIQSEKVCKKNAAKVDYSNDGIWGGGDAGGTGTRSLYHICSLTNSLWIPDRRTSTFNNILNRTNFFYSPYHSTWLV